MDYNTIISQIKSSLTKGIWSAADRISNRHIINMVLRKRSRVVSQEQEKKSLNNKFAFQTINCIELIEVDKSECNCLPSGIDCKILRTKQQIPTVLNFDTLKVMTLSGEKIFANSVDKVKYKQYSRLLPNKTVLSYYTTNKYIYLFGNTDLQFIKVEGVFETPDEVNLLNAICNGNVETTKQCLSALDTEFALTDAKLLDNIITLAKEELYKLLQYGAEDNLNNAKSNIAGQEIEDITKPNA